ncbi:uncharacterized protein LOC126797498 isoform X2 [Argentina anserina]|uniref:uncharacterized protein LOC126797498 isoform X2 n=1 Tax=Argentina anserina TaxID=57926 RepID=UPI00217657AA|nr:uncharacterized protein LOC126797498 isoform X2 [Potentilla anserina]
MSGDDTSEPPLGVLFSRKRGKTKSTKNPTQPIPIHADPVRAHPEPVPIDPESPRHNPPRVSVSMFDDSVENHFRVMHKVSELCGEKGYDEPIPETELHRLQSSTTFLREWADFKYEPRDVRFACEAESHDGEDVINLSQFSSAIVPQNEADETSSPELSQDFVMYVGGSVWALDWCPRVHETHDHHAKCEYIAISAHPPGSSYHKLGEKPRGKSTMTAAIVNCTEQKRPRGRPRKKPIEESIDKEAKEEKSTESKRPRGRPRKKSTDESVDNLDGRTNSVEILAIDFTKESSELHSMDCVPASTQGNDVQEENEKKQSSYRQTQPKTRGRPRKKPIKEPIDNLDGGSNNSGVLAIEYQKELLELHSMDSFLANTQGDEVQDDSGKKRKRYKKKVSKGESGEKPIDNSVDNLDGSSRLPEVLAVQYPKETSELHAMDRVPSLTQGHDAQEAQNGIRERSRPGAEIGSTSCSVLKDVALPRIIFCLAHHGKVAWDVKWRPLDEHDSRCKHQMGYLAVLLGNGSLEVWEVPAPHAIEVIYSSSSEEGTDPRFVKLAPVFRCSLLKSGDDISIPLTVEWSTSPPHDYLIAGCHDGTVAMWKFSASNASQDTRPLLCFRADTNPIRALSWAPGQSNSDSANVIATAGHGGLKFWDLRDPYRPLWDIDHIPRFIYSLDWLPEPRCVLLSFDDGTLRLLSLTKIASDAPATGKPFAGTKQQGLHNLACLPFAIWSVQISRLTGMVAYSGADGTVLRFQLTSKAVEKDAIRNRAPHFLCVSLTEEDSVVTISNPIPNNPFPLKTSRKAEPNKVKREHDKIATASEDQVLALCYGDDPSIELESGKEAASVRSKTRKSGDDRALVCMDQEPFNSQDEEIGEKGTSLKSIVNHKCKSSEKITEDEQELVCRREELTDRQEEKIGTAYEVFPSKLVAMHRVRWNMNKGSERWLCYGGAAGIVRCQEIVLSEIDTKWARKK